MCFKRNRRFKSSVFSIFTAINESKTLTKHISRECQCKFDGSKCNWSHMNADMCWCEHKNPKEHFVFERDYTWNPATWSYKNGKYLASITDDSEIACDEIIEVTKGIPTSFNEKKMACKTKNVYILLALLLITIALLIAVSIYCYLININQDKNIYHSITSQMRN